MRSGVALLALAVLAALPACGGGPLTRHEFAREASEICRRGNARVARIAIPSFTEPRQAVAALTHLVKVERVTLSALRGLEPPKSETADIDAWLALLDQMLDEVTLTSNALRRGDAFSALDAAARAMTLDGHGRGLARALGVGPCRLGQLVTTR